MDMEYITQLNLTNGDELNRLIWYKEQKGERAQTAGIRTGYFGRALQGLHTTYYEHGLMHHEVRGNILQSINGLGFEDINSSSQLSFQAMPLHETSIRLNGSTGVGSVIPNKTITLSLGDYTRTLAIDLHLVREGSEGEFLNQVSAMYCGKSSHHSLIGLEFIKLNLFQGLKLAVISLSENNVSQ